MTVTGGKISIISPTSSGLDLQTANLVIKGGTIEVKDANNNAIQVSASEYGGKKYGGTITITGGKVSATVSDAMRYRAIQAVSIANSASCLGTIKGGLSYGAKFALSGNEYQLYSSQSFYDVSLTKYGSKKTSFKFGSMKYGGCTYFMSGVSSNAFNTTTGKKVKSLEFKDLLSKIGDNAFANTKKLTKLTVNYMPITTKYKEYELMSLKLSKGASFGKKAFAKCGKDSGKGLALCYTGMTYGWNTITKSYYYPEASKYKSFFVKYGLPKAAKVTGKGKGK